MDNISIIEDYMIVSGDDFVIIGSDLKEIELTEVEMKKEEEEIQIHPLWTLQYIKFTDFNSLSNTIKIFEKDDYASFSNQTGIDIDIFNQVHSRVLLYPIELLTLNIGLDIDKYNELYKNTIIKMVVLLIVFKKEYKRVDEVVEYYIYKCSSVLINSFNVIPLMYRNWINEQNNFFVNPVSYVFSFNINTRKYTPISFGDYMLSLKNTYHKESLKELVHMFYRENIVNQFNYFEGFTYKQEKCIEELLNNIFDRFYFPFIIQYLSLYINIFFS